jgi:predicted nucleic acid-binding protein
MNSPEPARHVLVVDASLVVSLVTTEATTLTVQALWRRWENEDRYLLAPGLLRYEVTAALWQKVRRGSLTLLEAHDALVDALVLDIDHIQPPDLHIAALDMAARLSLRATYDAHYLALAEINGCPLWTGDTRLWQLARSAGLDWVHHPGERAN